MLRHFFRKNKPRVFLNSIKVIPGSDLSFVEKWVYNELENLDVRLQARLREIITLPHTPTAREAEADDLAIDIVVPKYETGDWGHGSIGDFGLLLFWRPRIKITARIFEVRTDKTVSTFSLVQKMPWLYYFGRIFRLSSWFSIRSGFKPEDFECMLIIGLMRLLDKMRKAI